MRNSENAGNASIFRGLRVHRGLGKRKQIFHAIHKQKFSTVSTGFSTERCESRRVRADFTGFFFFRALWKGHFSGKLSTEWEKIETAEKICGFPDFL